MYESVMCISYVLYFFVFDCFWRVERKGFQEMLLCPISHACLQSQLITLRRLVKACIMFHLL